MKNLKKVKEKLLSSGEVELLKTYASKPAIQEFAERRYLELLQAAGKKFNSFTQGVRHE